MLVPGVGHGWVRRNGWAIPIASVLHVVLRSWEGEDGHMSISKGGGRWESTVQWGGKEKKIHTSILLWINIFVSLSLWVSVRAFAMDTAWLITWWDPDLYHMVSISSPQFFPHNWRPGSDTEHQNKLIGGIFESRALNLGVGWSLRIYFLQVCLFRVF